MKKQHDLLSPAPHTEARFARWMNLCNKYKKTRNKFMREKRKLIIHHDVTSGLGIYTAALSCPTFLPTGEVI